MTTMQRYKTYVFLYTGFALMTCALCATMPPSFINGIPRSVSQMSSNQSVNGNSLSSTLKQLSGIVEPKLQMDPTSERASFQFDTTVMPQSAPMDMTKSLRTLTDTTRVAKPLQSGSDTETRIISANPTFLNLTFVNSVNDKRSVLLTADTIITKNTVNTSFIYVDFNSSLIYDDYNSSMIYDDFNTSMIYDAFNTSLNDDTVNASLIDNAQIVKPMLSTDTNYIKPQTTVGAPEVITNQPGFVSTTTLGRMAGMQLGINKAQTSNLSWNNSGILSANDLANMNIPGIKAVSIDPDATDRSKTLLPKALSIRSTDKINITDTMTSVETNISKNGSVQQISSLNTTVDNAIKETDVKPPGLGDEITLQPLGNVRDSVVNGWQKQNKPTRINKYFGLFKPLSANNSIIREADRMIDNMYKNTRNWLNFINVNITSPDNMAGELRPLDSLINTMFKKMSVKVFKEK